MSSFLSKVFEVVKEKMEKMKTKPFAWRVRNLYHLFKIYLHPISVEKNDGDKGLKLILTVTDTYKNYLQDKTKTEDMKTALAWKLQQGDLLTVENNENTENITGKNYLRLVK